MFIWVTNFENIHLVSILDKNQRIVGNFSAGTPLIAVSRSSSQQHLHLKLHLCQICEGVTPRPWRCSLWLPSAFFRRRPYEENGVLCTETWNRRQHLEIFSQILTKKMIMELVTQPCRRPLQKAPIAVPITTLQSPSQVLRRSKQQDQPILQYTLDFLLLAPLQIL